MYRINAAIEIKYLIFKISDNMELSITQKDICVICIPVNNIYETCRALLFYRQMPVNG